MPTSNSRDALLDRILNAALRAADPRVAVRRHVRRDGDALFVDDVRVALPDDVRLVAAGKAAAPMAAEMLTLLHGRSVSGVVVTKHGHVSSDCSPLTVIEAGHPVPDEGSLRGGAAVAAAVSDTDEHTLVIACVSGGASALLVAPEPGISLRTIQAVNDALLRSGADIAEMNAVRSRIDRLKAGGLVRRAAPARVLALILSDVIGDPLDVIASGLTFEPRAHNVLVGNNPQACEAARAEAESLGLHARVVTTTLRGEARDVGAAIAGEIAAAPPGTALIYGGETTVTLRGSGKGGRNQEAALAAAIALAECGAANNCVVAALGTDGTDGPTDAAGAVARPTTVARARALGLDPADFLARNDSYVLFDRLGDLLRTGPTGTNVADVIVAISP
jgi:hydroxypyruvate reductase